MPKKSKVKSVTRKKRGLFFYFKKWFFFNVIALVFFTGTTYLFHQTSKHYECANSKTCQSDLSVKIDNNAVGLFQGRQVTPPKIDAKEIANSSVLGVSTSEEKHIYVDLAAQTLYAFEGKNLFMKTFIASGKWGRTPVGNFHVWQKLIATRMAGGEGADAYDLPNVPYVMYFFHDFGLHGAYWHDNFGHTMSHGCVNMRQVDAKKLFEWADGPSNGNLGTPVSICNQLTSDNQCVQNNPIQ